MTDKDIIFSLECCDNGKCSECYFAFKGGCDNKLKTSALDLINRQQAEIEKARAEAIKEFADRLGEYIEYRYNENCDFVPYVRLSDIEKVVYEMVGE